MYQVQRPSRSEFVPVRNFRYHVRLWGQPAAGKRPLVMLHGWMDISASWQFVVDALAEEHFVIAPDWRGYGLTEGPPTDNFWFPDYLADLDFLLDHFAARQTVNLVGHSMGGNIAMMYAGSRPDRLKRLVNVEGFGMAANRPAEAPRRYAQWMDQLKAHQRGELAMKDYDNPAEVATRLRKTNPRLDQDKAEWLASQWSRRDPDGRWRILGDAAHKIVNANLFRLEEMLELYRAIRVPVLAVEGSDDNLSRWWQGRYTMDDYHQRLKEVADVRVARIEDAGHMVHHDQPGELAARIEAFLQQGSQPPGTKAFTPPSEM